MRDVLEEDGFVVEGDVIEQHEVLVDLAHVANMRDHGNSEFFCKKADNQKLAHSGHTQGIDLADGHRSGLEIVFKKNPVRHMLASGNLHRGDGLGDRAMAEHIVRMRGFLEPEEVQVAGGFGEGDGLVDRPLLIGIDHETHGVARSLSHEACAANIPGDILRADLQFHGRETLRRGLSDIAGHLLVAVVEPTNRGVVTGVACFQNAFAEVASGTG